MKASFAKFVILFTVLAVAGFSFYFLSSREEPSSLCPQARTTVSAPEKDARMKNILAPTEENIQAGKALFNSQAQPIPCSICHGFKGDSIGVIFQWIKPYARNFTCFQTMKDISDGQMFWVIRNGSHGTRMQAYKKLEDEQIWQLVLYLRSFSE
ncbi:MAG: cytochrome c [Nitrospinaceae bacterium]|nr:MAG: cytochrome c [Nitrospinaceae bacterium]